MSTQTPQRLAIQCADDGTPVGMQYSSCPDCNAQELADALVEARKEIIRLKALCEELRVAPQFLDITKPEHGVEIQIREDRSVIWVHVDGITRLRICQIPNLEIDARAALKKAEKDI